MRRYSNIALDTVLTADPGASGTTVSGVDFTGWPSPTGGDTALACIDWGTAAVELVEYTSRTSTALTCPGRATAGVDGTTRGPHNVGASVRHVASAADFEGFLRTVDYVAPTVTTKYLSSTVALVPSTTVALPTLDLAVLAGQVWEVEYLIPVNVTAGTAGVKPTLTVPAGTTGYIIYQGTTSGGTSVAFIAFSTNLTSGSGTAFITASFPGWTMVRATLFITTTGTVSIGLVTGASAAGSVYAGARLRAVKMHA